MKNKTQLSTDSKRANKFILEILAAARILSLFRIFWCRSELLKFFVLSRFGWTKQLTERIEKLSHWKLRLDFFSTRETILLIGGLGALGLYPLIKFEHSDMVIELNHLDRMQEPNLTDTSNSDQEEGVSWIIIFIFWKPSMKNWSIPLKNICADERDPFLLQF